MPKKYKQKSLLTKPKSSAHSNLSLSRPDPSSDVPATKSVNDLIRESRRGDVNERPQLIQNTSSIPPSLRAVLDVPVPPPPPPRVGIRGPSRLRRIPGPPPPRSWLTDSIHAPPKIRNIPWSRAHERSRIQRQTSTLPEGAFPDEKSLQHAILRSMTTNWSWHAEYDHEYLAELPVKIKQTLLSYLAVYNEGKGPNPIRLMFPAGLEREDLDEVRRLDFGNAIGGWSTLKKLERELEVDHTASTSKQKTPLPQQGEVPDTWDEEDDTEQSVPALVSTKGMRFKNLKHLSLAVSPGTSGSTASWAGLLSLATKLSTITSLSLAYWPQPTYTPNASTTVLKIQNPSVGSTPSVTYGGSNFYTAFDNDWREAAGILKSLSRSLYCLKWLDLTGCGHWFPALTWSQSDQFGEIQRGPDWNGSWRGLERLILAVGWSPGPPPGKHSSRYAASEVNSDSVSEVSEETTQSSLDVLSRLQTIRLGSDRSSTESSQPESWNVEEEREKYYYCMEVRRWTDTRDSAVEVAQKLRAVRREHGGKWIDVDLGPSEDFDVVETGS